MAGSRSPILRSSPAVMLSMTPKSINHSTMVSVDPDCPICLEPLSVRMQGEKPAVSVECGHRYHDACYKEYIVSCQDCCVCGSTLKLIDAHNNGRTNKFHSSRLEKLKNSTDNDSKDSFFSKRSVKIRSHPQPVLVNNPADDDPLDGYFHPLPALPSATTQASILPYLIVKSEFPSIAKSDQPKQLTCLVTIEVPSKSKLPIISTTEPGFSPPVSSYGINVSVDNFAPKQQQQESVLSDLADHVQDLIGIKSFGRLHLYDNLVVLRDDVSRPYTVYLFDTVILCIKERKLSRMDKIFGWSHGETQSEMQMHKRGMKLKGRIYIRHIKRLQDTSLLNEPWLTVIVNGGGEIRTTYRFKFPDREMLAKWHEKLTYVIEHAGRVGTTSMLSQRESENFSSLSVESPLQDTRSFTSRKSFSMTTPTSSFLSLSKNVQPHMTPSIQHAVSALEDCKQYHGWQDVITNHIPMDLVIVFSIGQSMQGIKLKLLKDALRFVIHNLGPQDRVSLVTFGNGRSGGTRNGDGSNGHATAFRRTPLLNTAHSENFVIIDKVLEELNPTLAMTSVPTSSSIVGINRSDVVGGINLGIDIITQRQTKNPVTGMLVLSDASDMSSQEERDMLASRAKTAGIVIDTFGFGITHEPWSLYTLAQATQGSYTYIKDWYQLRDGLSAYLGGLHATAIQKTCLKLKVPGTGGLFRIKKPSQRMCHTGGVSIDVAKDGLSGEVELGNLRYGEKRDVLITMEILPQIKKQQKRLGEDGQDLSMNICEVSGDESGTMEEVSLLEVDFSFMDLVTGTQIPHLPNPNLLNIILTRFVETASITKQPLPATPNIPPVSTTKMVQDPRSVSSTISKRPRSLPPSLLPLPRPSTSAHADIRITLRRMEILAGDMIFRALHLVARKNYYQAQRVLIETKTIISSMANRVAIALEQSSNAGESIDHIKGTSPVLNHFNNMILDLTGLVEFLPSQTEIFDRDSRKLALQMVLMFQFQKSWFGSESHNSGTTSPARLHCEPYYFAQSAGEYASILVKKSLEWGINHNVT